MIISAIGTVPAAHVVGTAPLFGDMSSIYWLTLDGQLDSTTTGIGSVVGGACGGASLGCPGLFAGGGVDAFQSVQPLRFAHAIVDAVENHVDALIAVSHRAGQDTPRRQRRVGESRQPFWCAHVRRVWWGRG